MGARKKKRRAACVERVSIVRSAAEENSPHKKKDRERENGSEVTRRASKLEKTEKLRAKRERETETEHLPGACKT